MTELQPQALIGIRLYVTRAIAMVESVRGDGRPKHRAEQPSDAVAHGSDYQEEEHEPKPGAAATELPAPRPPTSTRSLDVRCVPAFQARAILGMTVCWRSSSTPPYLTVRYRQADQLALCPASA